jgi:quaternary ammonium compound-resistance protein SugE
MSWVVLIVSGMFEAVWATALGRSEGFSRPAPTVVFLLGLLVSMGGLALALRELPTGTAYAVWVGIGAVTTATWAMAVDGEAVSVAKVLLLAGIVGCVMGLRAIE